MLYYDINTVYHSQETEHKQLGMSITVYYNTVLRILFTLISSLA